MQSENNASVLTRLRVVLVPVVAAPAPFSIHPQPAEGAPTPSLGPRLRKLHTRIGRAHHQAEGMAFSRALLEERATPTQLVGLLRSLVGSPAPAG
jgi:hypothetical protein